VRDDVRALSLRARTRAHPHEPLSDFEPASLALGPVSLSFDSAVSRMGFCRPIMRTAKNQHSGVGVTGRIACMAALGMVLLEACACNRAHGAQPAVIHPHLWPQTRPQLPADPALERKVDALLAGMTLEQKVGQLIQGDISTLTPADLRQYPLGSVLNGGNSKPGGQTLAPPAAWLTLANRFYLESM